VFDRSAGAGHDRVMSESPSLHPISSYDDFEHLRFDRPRPGVLLVTIDRPEVLNAANEQLHREFSEIWPVIDADSSVAASVITGAGRAFSAGGDLAMVERMTTDHAAVVEQWRDAKAVVDAMLTSVKPVVSAINGVAVGAGLAVALLADVSIIARSARLSDGHTRLGVAAGDHAAILWPLLCGMAKAKYYLMTADFIDGVEAERIGLVTRRVPDEDVVEEALAIAERLAQGSRTAIQWTKQVLNQWLVSNAPVFGESLALEMLGFLGPDAAEGLAAVKERRSPAFPSARPAP
jgi:enoyl-CoA hydratase